MTLGNHFELWNGLLGARIRITRILNSDNSNVEFWLRSMDPKFNIQTECWIESLDKNQWSRIRIYCKDKWKMTWGTNFELWIGLLEAWIKITRMLNSGSVQQSRNSIFKPNVEFEVWTRTSGLKFEFIARTNGKWHEELILSFGLDYWKLELR